ncbi:MAG TPA: hypothetical protein VJU18_02720 [Vicinamibacteria bacterium]|nr:hypothetical protein [Vicinamibacteria bacterium]
MLRIIAPFAFALSLAPSVHAATYYVSFSSGLDTNDGLTPATPFKTVTRVNGLALVATDEVLFKCGDVWRADVLRITRSGSAASPIVYGSYPDRACPNRPVLSGTETITGWTPWSGSIWVADLTAGANAGKFPNGINQLFRNGSRLRLGRWPNLGVGDGYSTIDAQPSGTQISDNELPAVDWTGATVHIRGMRWYILNRDVTADSGNTLTLNSAAGCWGGSCTGWGFFLNSHLSTLDQEGEWYYDAASRRAYLVSAADPDTATLEGSVVMAGESAYIGGVILGRHLQEHIHHVTLDNFEIRGWFDNGITTPVNLEKDENYNLLISNNLIKDVDGTSINLATWVWNAAANGNGYNGWRGGHDLQVVSNIIDAPNEYGINSYARSSTIQSNLIRNVAVVGNLGRAGIGCSNTDGEGQCTEPGAGIRLKVDNDGAYSSNLVTVSLNRLETVGHNGIDAFGYSNTLTRNLIRGACSTKGDCGAVRLFGNGTLATTTSHDVSLSENILLDTLGNTDGCHATYRALFGFGLYVDHYSRAILSTGNTVGRATAAGILYQDSTGDITDNVLFANSAGSGWSQQIVLTSGASTAVTSLTGNVMVGLLPNAGTLRIKNGTQATTSDRNGFYHQSRAAHVTVSDLGLDRTLAQWRTYSGQDPASTERVVSDLGRAELLYNDQDSTQILSLAKVYQDLDGNPVGATLTLGPFASQVLVPSDLIFEDGFQ